MVWKKAFILSKGQQQQRKMGVSGTNFIKAWNNVINISHLRHGFQMIKKMKAWVVEQRCALHKNNQLSLPSSLLFGVLLFCKIWRLTKLGDEWKPSFLLNMPQSFCETSKKAIYMRWLPMWLCDSTSYMSLKEGENFCCLCICRFLGGKKQHSFSEMRVWPNEKKVKKRKTGDAVRDLEKGVSSGINPSSHSHDTKRWKEMPLFELLNS